MTVDKPKQQNSWVPTLLILIAIAYLALVQYIPAINVFIQAFSKGVGPFLSNLSRPAFLHAAWLTLLLALFALPVNTVFGLGRSLGINSPVAL
jgi:sulfate/thiosulfate transport system permease protein